MPATKCPKCQVGNLKVEPIDEQRYRDFCTNPSCGFVEVRNRQGQKLLTDDRGSGQSPGRGPLLG